MSMKEVFNLVKDANEVVISWGGNIHNVDFDDQVYMEAFGDFVVNAILALDDGKVEIELAVKPYKKV